MAALTREAKVAEAERLSASGASNRQIGDQFGVTASCVWRWLHPQAAREKARRENRDPKTQARKRANARMRRALCSKCGSKCGIASAEPSRKKTGLCSKCEREKRGEDRRVTDEQVIALFLEGFSLKEIAFRIDSTAGAVGVRIARLRGEGRPLPYRRSFPNSAPVHPELAEPAA